MKMFYKTLTAMTVCGMLVLGSSTARAQRNDVIKSRIEKMTNKKQMRFATPDRMRHQSADNGIMLLPGKETYYLYNDKGECFLQYTFNTIYDNKGRKIWQHYEYPDGEKKNISYVYNEDDEIIMDTDTLYDDDDDEEDYLIMRNKHHYDDVVHNFQTSYDEEIFIDSEWYPVNINFKRKTTIIRDEQGRVIKNINSHSQDDGYKDDRCIEISYNDDNTVNIKIYNINDTKELTYSSDSIKMHENSGQFVNSEFTGYNSIFDFLSINRDYGVKPESYIENGYEYNTKREYYYTYDEDGELSSLFKSDLNNTDNHPNVYSNIIYTADSTFANYYYGKELNDDRMMKWGEDYICMTQKEVEKTNEHGDVESDLSYTWMLYDVSGTPVPTYEKEGNWKFSDGFKYLYKYDGNKLIEKIVMLSNTDGFMNQEKWVYSDYVEIVPTGIRDMAENSAVEISYRGGKLVFGAECAYSIYDVQGRTVMQGRAADADVNSLARGMYVVKAGSSSMKFVR